MNKISNTLQDYGEVYLHTHATVNAINKIPNTLQGYGKVF